MKEIDLVIDTEEIADYFYSQLAMRGTYRVKRKSSK